MRRLKLWADGVLTIAIVMAVLIFLLTLLHFALTGADRAVTWLMSFF
jgi:hypothetical protein